MGDVSKQISFSAFSCAEEKEEKKRIEDAKKEQKRIPCIVQSCTQSK